MDEIKFTKPNAMKPRKQTSMFDYEGFVAKFEPKKTTDDCYTPQEVYDIVLSYVGEHYDLAGKNILRPFYPGGDYEAVEYGSDDVVVDNPPFSIISQIVRYYDAHGVKYFLFAPHLTLFSSQNEATKVVCGVTVTYENGAKVKTSFMTNLMSDVEVMSCPELYAKLDALNHTGAKLPKYDYPANVLMVSMVAPMSMRGVDFKVAKRDAVFCRGLASQKKQGKALFGAGYLISDAAAAEKAAAEKAAAVERILWELSEEEMETIKRLG